MRDSSVASASRRLYMNRLLPRDSRDSTTLCENLDRNSRFSHHDEEDQDAVEGVRWFALKSIENGREQTPRCRFMPYTFDRTRVSQLPTKHVAFLFTGRAPRGAPAGPGSYHPGPHPG